MKKSTKYILLLVILFIVFNQIKQKINAKKSDKDIIAKSNTYNIEIDFNTKNPKKVNANIFGLNTGFIWNQEVDKDSNFVTLLRKSNNVVLRFPGGGVANDYQPDEPGYGYNPLKRPIAKPLIMLYHQTKDRKYNIIENFISLCHQSNAKAIYCANVLNGSVEKMLYVIDKLQQANIEIVGVELGNEFNLGNYRHIFPNAKVYVDTIKHYITALRLKHPNIPIGLIAAPLDLNTMNDKRSQFMHEWNKTVSQVDFDAYIVHHYFPFDDKQKVFDNIYYKSAIILDSVTQTFIPNSINYFNTIPTQKPKKIWLTEWNIWNAYAFNTFLQASFVAQFLNHLATQDTNQNCNITCMHDIGGMIGAAKKKVSYTYQNNTRYASSVFFSFQFLSNIVVNENAQSIEIKQTKKIDLFKTFAYYNEKSKKYFIYFINTSNNEISLKINRAIKKITQQYIIANKLYAHVGDAHFLKDNPNKNYQIKYEEKQVESNMLTIKPYSLGTLSFSE